MKNIPNNLGEWYAAQTLAYAEEKYGDDSREDDHYPRPSPVEPRPCTCLVDEVCRAHPWGDEEGALTR